MKLPKLEKQKGAFLGMRGGSDLYACSYYDTDEVLAYKKAAETLLAKYKELKLDKVKTTKARKKTS
jgi:hypothetical protein